MIGLVLIIIAATLFAALIAGFVALLWIDVAKNWRDFRRGKHRDRI